MLGLWRKLLEPRTWERVYRERLCDSLAANIGSVAAVASGDFRLREKFDMILRPHHAYSLLRAADTAVAEGVSELLVVEFGVASGTGLMNLIDIGRTVEKETGVSFYYVGFDTGEGMPIAESYKDHPELYKRGDYQMPNRAELLSALEGCGELILGDLADTLPQFLCENKRVLGFASFDVDYWSSTSAALQLLLIDKSFLMPSTLIYFDDIVMPTHSQFAGQLLAIDDFNAKHTHRKIAPVRGLKESRVFRRPHWHSQVYYLHAFDHEARSPQNQEEGKGRVFFNPYTSTKSKS